MLRAAVWCAERWSCGHFIGSCLGEPGVDGDLAGEMELLDACVCVGRVVEGGGLDAESHDAEHDELADGVAP